MLFSRNCKKKTIDEGFCFSTWLLKMSIVEFEVFRKHFFAFLSCCSPEAILLNVSHVRAHTTFKTEPPSQHLPVKSNTLYRRGSLPDNEQHFEFILYQIRYRSCKHLKSIFLFGLPTSGGGPQIKDFK